MKKQTTSRLCDAALGYLRLSLRLAVVLAFCLLLLALAAINLRFETLYIRAYIPLYFDVLRAVLLLGALGTLCMQALFAEV